MICWDFELCSFKILETFFSNESLTVFQSFYVFKLVSRLIIWFSFLAYIIYDIDMIYLDQPVKMKQNPSINCVISIYMAFMINLDTSFSIMMLYWTRVFNQNVHNHSFYVFRRTDFWLNTDIHSNFFLVVKSSFPCKERKIHLFIDTFNFYSVTLSILK